MLVPGDTSKVSTPGLTPGAPQFSAVRGTGGEGRSLLLLSHILEQTTLQPEVRTLALMQGVKGCDPEQCLWLFSHEVAP